MSRFFAIAMKSLS